LQSETTGADWSSIAIRLSVSQITSLKAVEDERIAGVDLAALMAG
jgi:hypothetical protein